MDCIERILGVRPTLGGRHPAYGTHNALLAMGGCSYLEVIAPDPAASEGVRGSIFGLQHLAEPRLATWAIRSDRIDEEAAKARELGIGPVGEGARQTEDGRTLSWRLSDPKAMPFDGALPFLIDWGETPHPSGTLPSGGELRGLRVEHPDFQRVRQAMTKLGLTVEVVPAARTRLVATLRTSRGWVDIS